MATETESGAFDLDRLESLRYDNPRLAAERAEEAIEVVDLADVPRVLGIYASAHRLLGNLEIAQKVLGGAMEMASQRGDDSALADLAVRAAYVELDLGDRDKGLLLTEKATLLHVLSGDRIGTGKALIDQGVILGCLERASEAVRAQKVAIDQYLPTDSSSLTLNRYRYAAFQGLGMSYYQLGDMRSARKYGRLAATTAGGTGRAAEGKLLWLLAMIASYDGDHVEAERYWSQTIRIYEDLGAPLDAALASTELVRCRLAQGHIAEAYESARGMVALLEPLRRNTIASAALADLVRCGFTCEGLSAALLDNTRAGIEKARARL